MLVYENLTEVCVKAISFRKMLGLALLACYFYWQLPFVFMVMERGDWSNEFVAFSAFCACVTVILLPCVLVKSEVALKMLRFATVSSGVFPMLAAAWVGVVPSRESLLASIMLGAYGVSFYFCLRE